MAATKLDEFGRPIDNPFFGGGLGQQLASLPGTPVLNQNPFGPPLDMSGGTNVSNTPAPGSGQGIGTTTGGGGPPKLPGDAFQNYTPPDPGSLGYGGTGWGAGPSPAPAPGGPPQPGTSPIQTNPGLPPPASTAGTGGFFGGQNPWAQNVGASINDQPVSFASPGNPNTNYLTPEAAGKVGQTFGANVVSQNLNNMASPGSSAPSAPIYGLDFGKGDIQDAGMGAFQLARGDRPEDIAARYAAGINNTGWGGPAPATARSDADGMWNYSAPTSTYDPSQSNAQQAQLIQWLKGQIGQA